MKRLFILIILVVLCSGQIFSQSNYHLTQFQQQYAMINPAYTGIEDYLDLKITYRNKWTGLNGSPKSSLLTIHSPINSKTSYNQAPIRISNPNQKQWIEDQKARLNFHGIGGQISYFTQGAYKNFVVMANYAYHIPVSRKIKISLGTSMGIESYRIDLDDISVWDPVNDQLYQSLLSSSNKLDYFTLKMGGNIYSNLFHFGISYAPLIELKLGSGNDSMLRENRLDIVGGAKFKVRPNYMVAPQIWLSISESNNFSGTAILGMHFGKIVYAGMGYSSNQNVLFCFNFFVQEKLTIGYSFESKGLEESNLGRLTHEITVNFALFNHLNSKPRVW